MQYALKQVIFQGFELLIMKRFESLDGRMGFRCSPELLKITENAMKEIILEEVCKLEDRVRYLKPDEAVIQRLYQYGKNCCKQFIISPDCIVRKKLFLGENTMADAKLKDKDEFELLDVDEPDDEVITNAKPMHVKAKEEVIKKKTNEQKLQEAKDKMAKVRAGKGKYVIKKFVVAKGAKGLITKIAKDESYKYPYTVSVVDEELPKGFMVEASAKEIEGDLKKNGKVIFKQEIRDCEWKVKA